MPRLGDHLFPQTSQVAQNNSGEPSKRRLASPSHRHGQVRMRPPSSTIFAMLHRGPRLQPSAQPSTACRRLAATSSAIRAADPTETEYTRTHYYNYNISITIGYILAKDVHRLQIPICVKKRKKKKRLSWDRAIIKMCGGLYHFMINLLESTSNLLPLANKTSFTKWNGKPSRAQTLICLPCCAIMASS